MSTGFRWRHDLRTRITLAILIVTSIGSSLFAFFMFLSNEGLEDVVLEHQVRDELQTLLALSEENPMAATIQSALVKGYVGVSNPQLPNVLKGLEPGDYHSVAIGERQYQILVADNGGRRYYVSYDITEWENREQQMIAILILGVLLVSGASVWVGFWASRQIVAPVTRLARRVSALQPSERNVRIASEFEGDEVSSIARAFDRFMERLDGFVTREQSFTSAASHELRTPLAVMQGAADVLTDQPELGATSKRAIRRIHRANREMREFIEALLFLSREPEKLSTQAESCDLRQISAHLAEDYQDLYGTDAIEISFSSDNSLALSVAPSLPTMVISNLVRNAIEHTTEGTVTVRLAGNSLTVQDSGSGIAEGNLDRVFDSDFTTKGAGHGMGLHIVKRICDQCGWNITINSEPGVGTTIVINFSKGT